MRRFVFVLLGLVVALLYACSSDNGDAGGGEITNPSADGGGADGASGDDGATAGTFNVKGAEATSSTSVTVTFDAPVSSGQATTLANYSIPGLTLSGTAQLSPARDVVTLTTSVQAAQAYTVTVANVTRLRDGAPLTNASELFFGRGTFNVASAAAVSATKIRVTFDAPPDDAQATTLANYDVPGLTLSSPELLGNTVTLTTTVQSVMGYTVTVSNVKRKSDAEPLTVKTADFTGRTPFTITNVTAPNAVTLKITFDAAPTMAQAVNLASYAIPNLTLSGTPVLDGNTVSLTTSPQAAQTYTLTVNGVTRTGDSEPILDKNKDFAGKKPAKLLITELAPADATGNRFVELVAIEDGALGQLTLRSARATDPLYVFADRDVVTDDRFVVHLTALPGPTGYAQEDVSGTITESTEPRASSTAYDVYSADTALTSTDNVVSVTIGSTTEDAVAFSQHSGTSSAQAMTAYAAAKTAGQWSFTAVPVLGTNDCATQLEAVNASATSVPACGGWPAQVTTGYSLQRNGKVDTNSKADWNVAAETLGTDNAPFCADSEGAKLVLDEVNPNGPDLTELYVAKGGWLRGFSLRRDPRVGTLGGTNLATMPDVCVATGDIIVVHDSVSGGTSETTAKDQIPNATTPENYDTAWDFYASASLPFAVSIVLAVRDATDAYIDAAAFTDGTSSTNYDAALQYVQSLGLWMPADCGGALCDDLSTPTSRQVAADWSTVDGTASGNSMRKSSPAAARTAASWAVGTSSFGAGN